MDKIFTTLKHITKKQASDSGLALVLFFLILALFLKSFLLIKIGLIILAAAMIWPMLFLPFAFLWFGLAKALSLVTTKILLSAVFFVFVIPVGLMRKLFKKDSLKLKKFKQGTETVMITRDHLFTAEDLKNQY